MENILMKRCPRYMNCRANLCPLDEEKDKRSGPFRGEPKCTLGKDILNKLLKMEEE